MLDNILNIVKEKAMDVVTGSNAIPEEKKLQTVEATTNALADGLKQNLHIGNISQLTSLFGGGSSPVENPMISSIKNNVINALTQKVGLSQGIATTIATTVVSAVMKTFSNKVNDPNDKGFNLDSLIGAFTGGNGGNAQNGESSAGGLLGSLGKLFK